MIDHDPVEEYDDWVVVKRQRITILVPPLSPEHPQTEIPESNHTQTKSRKNIRRSLNIHKTRFWDQSKDGPKKPAVIPSENEVPVDGEHKKTAVTPSKKRIQNAGVRIKPQKSVHNLVPVPDNQTLANGSGDISGNPLLQQASLLHFTGDANVAVPNRRRTIRPSGMIGGAPRLPVGALNVVNQRMRALNIERELKGFGGLRNWLAYHGLDRFIKIFERKRLGVYQLVNLTVSKLKDMGAHAVGPRRKLIHALDRLCQPSYLKALQ
ncbi:putative Connector enhancer of kinase suppressor of ras 2 [Cocos nucifera]|uniref:Putative Connector enhancer of kinase suppressor of ras 2 n=1 Tax=Cocos nucifera TaxID=13894 RepID=A0A8K0IUZ3_COCNU|nr:putative Connector enhancer of kinase suppressor of ras 2 [Cocos nucifera]